MNKLGALDDLDPNNVGGREQLINRMLNHQTAILEVKSVVNSRKPPRAHVDANKDKKNAQPVKYKRIQEYGNVYATFKAVTATQKPRIDVKEPETTKFKSFWGKKKKTEQFQDRQHELNLRAQRARIGGIGAMNERKKNPHDPLAHPTYLLTTAQQPKPNSALLNQILKPQKVANPVVWNRLTGKGKDEKEEEGGAYLKRTIERPCSAPYQQRQTKPPQPVVDKSKKNQMVKTITEDDYTKYKQQYNQMYRKPASGTKQSKDLYGNDELDFVDEIPKAVKNDKENLENLKFLLIQLIIKYRIFKATDLKVMFARATIHNIDIIPLKVLDEMYEQIQKELLD